MKRIALFILLTAALSTPMWWLSRASGFYTALLMWCPGLAAIITLKLTGGSLSELGWRGTRWKWLVGGWLLTTGYWVVGYGVACAFGRIGFPNTAQLMEISKSTFLYSGSSKTIALIILFGYASTAGVVNGIGRALGEELGWRGLLAPEACSKFGMFPGAVLSGLVWALWHYPLMIGETSKVGILNFTLAVVGIGSWYAWFRVRSESVWPTAFMHALHNALRSGFFGILAFNTVPSSPLWLGETGYALGGTGVALIVGFGIFQMRDKG